MAIINSDKFNAFGVFALEYRLGIEGFYRLIGESREDVIETVENLKNNDMDKYRMYSFLLYSDGLNDAKTLALTRNAMREYLSVEKDETLTKEEREEKLNSILMPTDIAFDSVPLFGDNDRTHEDYIKISNYRLKYALSANQIAQDENERKRISDHETRYDPEMIERLKNLETYLLSNRATARYLDKKYNAYDIEDYSSNIKYVEKFNDSISEEEYGLQK